MNKREDIVGAFFPGRAPFSITPLGSGRINDTWLVAFDKGVPEKIVLQRINTQVFHNPESIMTNLRILSGHLRRYFSAQPGGGPDRWRVVTPYLTPEGSDHQYDNSGGFWRAIFFIDGACSFERIENQEHAFEAGRALGIFHRGTAELEVDEFVDTLPGFHVTPQYLTRYDKVAESLGPGLRSDDEGFCAGFIEQYRKKVHVLEEALENGTLNKRIIHGDPKVSNIMFDDKTGRAVGMVDLDTVKPGLLHYDLGDCFRSCCNPAGGSGNDHAAVQFDTAIFSSVLRGYLQEMGAYLTDADYDLIGSAICLISFELGLRYFTDHLEGDVYFRVEVPGQNLKRGISQFLLVADIERKDKEIKAIINSCR